MKLIYGHIEAKENKAILFLKGEIGKTINGDSFADEILKASMQYKNIDILINTIGGSVVQGYSIITAIGLAQDAGINVRLINTGVAYSMGGFILASGKPGTRFAYDYSMGMIHDPRVSGDVQLTDTEKEMIQKSIDAIAIMTAGKTGKSIEDVKELMKAEKYLSPDEAMSYGIIDEVIKTGKMINIAPAARYDLMVACDKITEDLLTIKTTKNMSKINGVLLLNAEASEEAQLLAIAEIKAKADKLKAVEGELESAKAEIGKLNAKFENAEKETKRVKAESIVSKAIEMGKITADAKEEWIEDVIANEEKAEKKLNAIPVASGSINAQLEGKSGSKSDDKAKAEAYEKLMDDPDKMSEMDAKTLDEMEAAYKKMKAVTIKVIE